MGGIHIVGIYKITNKENGKVYIGQSDNVEQRTSEHEQKRRVTIDDYINIFSAENFESEILEECTEKELDDKEQSYIAQFDSNHQEDAFINPSDKKDARSTRRCYAEYRFSKEVFEEISKLPLEPAFQYQWET